MGSSRIEGRIDEKGKTTREGRLTHTLYGPVITDMNAKYFLGTEIASNNTGELTAICERPYWLKDTKKQTDHLLSTKTQNTLQK